MEDLNAQNGRTVKAVVVTVAVGAATVLSAGATARQQGPALESLIRKPR
jgi:hypothetical protein